MLCINKEAAENKASRAKRFFTEESKENAEFIHQVCFTEALTWLFSYYNMAFGCPANFLILDQLVAQSRAAHHTGQQPLVHCIAPRIAVESSLKINCVLVFFTDSRVYLCDSVENDGVLFQLMWIKRIWPTQFSRILCNFFFNILYIFLNTLCSLATKLMGYIIKNCKEKIKR